MWTERGPIEARELLQPVTPSKSSGPNSDFHWIEASRAIAFFQGYMHYCNVIEIVATSHITKRNNSWGGNPFISAP